MPTAFKKLPNARSPRDSASLAALQRLAAALPILLGKNLPPRITPSVVINSLATFVGTSPRCLRRRDHASRTPRASRQLVDRKLHVRRLPLVGLAWHEYALPNSRPDSATCSQLSPSEPHPFRAPLGCPCRRCPCPRTSASCNGRNSRDTAARVRGLTRD